MSCGGNHPAVVWGVCYLWLSSMAMVLWAITLFICITDVVGMLRLDVVLALALLSGLIMAPANAYMLHMISKGEGIDPTATVMCCPLWLCIASVIMVNFSGAFLCAYKIHTCSETIEEALDKAMKLYRSNSKYKRFMDSIQWAIKCCGLDSYTDWFSRDWYDKIRDYEWDPYQKQSKRESYVTDSVPLSCCKTGSCVSNYLTEMGTASINPDGCAEQAYKIVMAGLTLQLILFISIIVVEAAMVFLTVANLIRVRGPDEFWRKRKIFRLAAHYIGRRRNAYSVAVRNVHRALVYATKARELKKEDMKDLWNTRITAACEQHNITHFQLKEGLDRAHIMLDRKSLSNLASWEPRTFESLAAVAKEKLRLDGFIDFSDKKHPTGINLNLKDVMLEAWLKENKK